MDHHRPQWNGKTNGFSIAALTLSFFGCAGLVSIALGIVGLTQSRRNGDKRGKVFAIAALSICGLWIAALAVAIGVAVARDAADGPDRDQAGVLRGERSLSLRELRPGDCVKDLAHESGDYLDALPCTQAHSSEFYATFDLPAGTTDKEKAGDAGCEQRFQTYAGTKRPAGAKYILFTARLDEIGETGDPGVLCFAHQITGTTTGSLRR
ncbi:DUF4190 domain-containing protein [Actinoplanes sp. NPDC049596]|uniref:DUF4190 domain-containing protein n=1 Tax=unclassified Actinoplanes TaxID=2626549 RepID=UPI003429B69F